MYKEVLSAVNNVSIYPLFSFTVFFAFFILIAAWLIRSKKEEFDTVSKTPLHDNLTEEL